MYCRIMKMPNAGAIQGTIMAKNGSVRPTWVKITNRGSRTTM